MKYFKLLLMVLLTANIHAQSTTSGEGFSTSTSLTDAELKTAIDSYTKMMQSDTYLQIEKNNTIIAVKMMKLKMPDKEILEITKKTGLSEDKRLSEIKALIENFLSNHLSRTKFKSVKEGIDLLYGTIELTVKMSNENKELFRLLANANGKQISEIVKPEQERRREKIFGKQ